MCDRRTIVRTSGIAAGSGDGARDLVVRSPAGRATRDRETAARQQFIAATAEGRARASFGSLSTQMRQPRSATTPSSGNIPER